MNKLEIEYKRRTDGIAKYGKALLGSDPKLFQQVSNSLRELHILK